MTESRSVVYVAPPIAVQNPSRESKSAGFWSPISCNLIYSPRNALLVDPPVTTKQTEELVEWIEKIAPNRKLRYITHGHGNHFFGVRLLLKRFSEAFAVATPSTVKHMEQQIEERSFSQIWESRFPGQIYKSFALTKSLPANL